MIMKPADELIEKYKKEISDIAEIIDPYDELYWKDLSLGWALANGLNPSPEYTDEEAKDNAHNFSLYIHHETDLAG